MDKKYLQLFTELTRAVEIISEQVMDYDKTQNDDKGFKTAQIMRNDFATLHDKLEENNPILTKSDYAKLLVAAMIVTDNLEDKIKNERKAVEGYKIDIIPKLSRINDETHSDEEANNLAMEIFTI